MRDDDILRRIELWATGATIHNVRGLIGQYRTWADIVDHPDKYPWLTPEAVAEAERNLATVARTMREYMGHGDYRRARRDNPLEGEETRADFPWTRVRVREGGYNYVVPLDRPQRRRLVCGDGRVFNFGLSEVGLVRADPLPESTCQAVERHYARWGKLPGWSLMLFNGHGGPTLYDDWFRYEEEKLP